MKNKKVIGSIIFVIALFFMLNTFDTGIIQEIGIWAYILAVVGIAGVFFSLNTGDRVKLFLYTVVFLTGIFLVVINNFVLLNPGMILLPAVLFIIGGALLMLFIDNSGQKAFLIAGSFLIIISLLLIFVIKTGYILTYANKMSFYILDFWPAIFIVLGFLLLAGRYK